MESSYTDRRTPSEIDKYARKLWALLKAEAVKSRKQQCTLKQTDQDFGNYVSTNLTIG